jgi:endonuclease YncB( thermonuclease family)
MKTKHLLFVILFLTSGIAYYYLTDTSPTLETHQITSVIDGDTVELSTGQRVRLKGINAPESSMKYYEEAKNFTRVMTENKTVRLEIYGLDKYRRLLAHIFINERNINEQILSEGLATLYYYEPDAHYKELKQAEEFARLNSKGLWKQSPNYYCVRIIEFRTEEPEIIILRNECNREIEITIKDDANHIYHEILGANSILKKETSHIWNNDGDTLYIYDSEGLLIFYRYD